MSNITVYNKFNKFNAAPFAAKKIGIYNKSTNQRVGEISLGSALIKTPQDRGRLLYRVGLISDIHIDSQDESNLASADRDYWVGDEAKTDFRRALNFFSNLSPRPAMICSTGDIGLSNPSDELSSYKSIKEDDSYAPIPIHVCTGNHDVYSGNYGASSFKSYTRGIRETTGHTIIESPTNQNSYYFTHSYGNLTDVYVIFSMYQNTPTDGNAYLDSDLTWLEGVLNKFINKRVFIFTHYFFPAYAGNLGRAKGASGGGMYGTNKGMGGNSTLEARFMRLLANHPNTIWFSGHSHWKYDCQRHQANANIDRFANGDTVNGVRYEGKENGAYTIHLSSLSSPIACPDGGYDTAEHSSTYYGSKESQGYGKPAGSELAYMDIYDHGVEFIGIDMNTEDTTEYVTDERNMKYIPIANYWLDDTIQESATVILLASNWTKNQNISSSTGASSSSTFAVATDYIKVVQGNKYLLTVKNIKPNSTTGCNSVCLYAYDANKNYLGRILGNTFAPNGSSNYQYYFDGLVWKDSSNGTIDPLTTVNSNNVASIEDMIECDITERIFDNTNSNGTSGTTTYTGEIAYIRMRVQATGSASEYSSIQDSIINEWVSLKEVNLTGESGGVEGSTPVIPEQPSNNYYIPGNASADYLIYNLSSGQERQIAIASVAADGMNIGGNNTSTIVTQNSGFTNRGTGITQEQAVENEDKLKNDIQALVNSNPNYILTLKKINNETISIKNAAGKYLGGTAGSGNLTWSDQETYIKFSSVTGSTGSTCVVDQTNNSYLVRLALADNDTAYLYCSESPYWRDSTPGGWTLYYLYWIAETPSE